MLPSMFQKWHTKASMDPYKEKLTYIKKFKKNNL